MNNIGQLTISAEATLHDALRQLNETGQGILLLVDAEGKLLRTITDGDMRRQLLAGHVLSERLSILPAINSLVAHEGISPEAALELLNDRQLDHLPVVDATGRPIDVILRRELDQRILLSTPHLGEYEMGFIEEAFRTNWVAPLGPNVDAFEHELATYVGVGHAVAVSSGTAALHLALRVLGVSAGDTVFCSTLTFVASANPILYQGARPVFIDSEPESWNMSPPALARALTDAAAANRLPKAVIVVNLYGQSADMDRINALCDHYGVPVIEDAAESLGANYKGYASGTLGRLGVYSFNGNKIITTSGGGMLVSNDAALIDKARYLSTQAREPAPWYSHSEVGYNYRMSNVLAGIGRGQLKVLEDRIRLRRTIFEQYRQRLAAIEALGWMPEAPYGRSTRWLSVCVIDVNRTSITPKEMISVLSRGGIEARHVWRPMHRQPLFDGCAYYPHEPDYSFSDEAFVRGVCLPSGSNMTAEQQERVIRVVDSLFQSMKVQHG